MILFLKFLQFWLRLVFWLPGNLPLYKVWFLSWIFSRCLKHTRTKKLVAKNIGLLFPNVKTGKLADRLLANACYGVLELLALPYFRPGHWHRVIQLSGLANVNTAFGQRGGVIFLTIHAGNYELIPLSLAQTGYKINTVLRADDHPVFKLLNQSRRVGGVKLINVLKEDMYKACIDVLSGNEGVIILADTGALESRHELVDFLGHKVPVATGWLTLAQRANCLVVPTIAYKNGKTNTIAFCQPVSVTKNNRDQVKQQVLQLFEQHIRAHPEQWGIFLNAYETERMVGINK